MKCHKSNFIELSQLMDVCKFWQNVKKKLQNCRKVLKTLSNLQTKRKLPKVFYKPLNYSQLCIIFNQTESEY